MTLTLPQHSNFADYVFFDIGLLLFWTKMSNMYSRLFFQCTPLQTYDRVQLSLHIVEPDETTTTFFDILSFECNKHQHFGLDDPIVIETNIHSINGSHGDFSVYVGMLQPQSVYCLQVRQLSFVLLFVIRNSMSVTYLD
jgi:hypothetical protein